MVFFASLRILFYIPNQASALAGATYIYLPIHLKSNSKLQSINHDSSASAKCSSPCVLPDSNANLTYPV